MMDCKKNTALIPKPKLENDFYDWYERHENKKNLVRRHKFDLIFIGDSITHFFEGHPGIANKGDSIWQNFYADRNALNLGFGWDRIQNVLWRLENGEFENQCPAWVVLNIGTNNLTETANAPKNTSEEIGEGIKALCEFILDRSSKTRILLMGIFPRGLPNDLQRFEINAINLYIKTLAQVTFMDIGNKFVDAAGNIDPQIMPDLVHPSTSGYRIWAESIDPLLTV